MILFSFFRIPKLSVEGSIPFARSNVFRHLRVPFRSTSTLGAESPASPLVA